jgi:hypothetical protein
VHPNDHVNRGQSTNDSFPTAMHIALVLAIHKKLLPSLKRLRTSLEEKAAEFKDVVKVGRTHLQDATPITLGQEFSAWAYQAQMSEDRVQDALKRLYPLAQGGRVLKAYVYVGSGYSIQYVCSVHSHSLCRHCSRHWAQYTHTCCTPTLCRHCSRHWAQYTHTYCTPTLCRHCSRHWAEYTHTYCTPTLCRHCSRHWAEYTHLLYTHTVQALQ